MSVLMSQLLCRFSTALTSLKLDGGRLVFEPEEPPQLTALKELTLSCLMMSQPWLRIIYASNVKHVMFDRCPIRVDEQDALPTSAGKLR